MAMFGRKENEMSSSETNSQVSGGMQRASVGSADPMAQRSPMPVSAASVPAVSRRSVEPSSHSPSRRPGDRGSDNAERKLTVGRGLSLSGEITACDVLVVEGSMEAKLPDGKLLEIAESGQFRGSAEVENADIAGRYDGQLIVHGRLTVRGTGKISGIIKYGELEVSAGGQIIGEMQVAGGGQQQASPQAGIGSSFRSSAARFVAPMPEEEDEAAAQQRAMKA